MPTPQPAAPAAHTPTPWKTHPALPMMVIAECDNGLVANCDDPNNQSECRHNAALIVRAVNSHAELVEMARELLAFANDNRTIDLRGHLLKAVKLARKLNSEVAS